MKKTKVLLKGAMVLAFGLSSAMLVNNIDSLNITKSMAAEEILQDNEKEQALTSLSAAKTILEEKVEFFEKFKETRAYKETSESNKKELNEEIGRIEEAIYKANEAIESDYSKEQLDKIHDEVLYPSISSLNDIFKKIYKEDSKIGKLYEAHFAANTNKESDIPGKYLIDYKVAKSNIDEEFEKIWLENKIYSDKKIDEVLDKYYTVVKKINSENSLYNKTIKMKEAIKKNKDMVTGLKWANDVMPNVVKKYQKEFNKIMEDSKKAIENAENWLEKNS